MPNENAFKYKEKGKFGVTFLEWDLLSHRFSATESLFSYAMSRVDSDALLEDFAHLSDVHPDDQARLDAHLKDAKSGKTHDGITIRFKTTQDNYSWTCFSMRHFFDESKKATRVIATLLDFDEEIEYNQNLERENQDLLNIINGISLGICIFEMGDKVTPAYLSDRACAIFGYTSEEMDERIAQKEPILFNKQNQDDPLAQLPEHLFISLVAGETVESKVGIKRKDGVWILVNILGTLSSKSADKQLCYFTVRDISALNMDENVRSWQEERYRILSESEQVVTFDYNVETDVLNYNIYSAEEGLKNIGIVNFLREIENDKRIHPTSIEAVGEAIGKAKETHSSNAMDVLADFRGQGYRWWHLRYTSVVDEKSNECHVVGRADDIHHEKENEARLLASVDKEASFRRSITAGAILALEFDIETGQRVISKSDILPSTIPEDIRLDELISQMAQHVHPDDKALMQQYRDVKATMLSLAESRRKVSFDCRLRSVYEGYEGYRWLGMTYMYAVPKEQGYQHVLIYVIDINEKKNSQLMLMDQAKRDPLTGLLNRASFKEFFTDLIESEEIDQSRKRGQDAFVMVDMNSLKEINDTYGYAFGDKMLKGVAITLQAIRCESAARLDGDKFALCIHEIPNQEVFCEQMRILCSALTQKVNEHVTLSATIGISIFPTDARDYDELYEKANQALCMAKKMGTQDFAFYSPEINLEDIEKTNSRPAKKPETGEKQIFIRTFGYFDVFVDGQAIPFKVVKAKELLALMVDRRGGFLSAGDAISFLWENEPANELTMSRYRKVAMRLKSILAEFGIEEIIESINGLRRVIPEKFSCDYYDYVDATPEVRGHFPGAYLTNYSWAESTLSVLEEMSIKE